MRPAAALAALGVAALAACGGGSDGAGEAQPPQATPTRDVEVGAVDHAFTGVEALQLRAGEVVRLVLRNQGAARHELQVLDATGRVVGRVPAIGAGEVGTGTATFATAGRHRFICDVDDHLTRGMRAVATVG